MQRNQSHTSTAVPMDDAYLTLKQAARGWPGSPRYEQVWRWAQRGIPTTDGVLTLRTIRTNKLVTRAEWVQEFIAAMNSAYRDGRVLTRRPRQIHRRISADRPQVLSHADAKARSKRELGI